MRHAFECAATLLLVVAACSNGPQYGESAYSVTGTDGGGSDGSEYGGTSTETETTTTTTGETEGSGSTTTADEEEDAEYAPPEEKPHSTIEISYDDGHPDSLLSTPPSVTQFCSIPKEVLADTPIYPGDPVMTHCKIWTTTSGEPPTSISIHLYCGNGPGASYEYFDCYDNVSLVPPKQTTSGSISYGLGKGKELPAATCQAYIARALSICEVTGKQAGQE